MRIGIHTGSLVAGSLGSADRLKYTVVGDNVVTAQRLEATDVVPHDYDAHPCRILISDDTHARLGDLFQTESVGKLQLKGKAEPVGAHRVLRHNDAPPTIRTRTS